MYGDVVMGVQKLHKNEHEPDDEVMDELKREVGVLQDNHLNETDMIFLFKQKTAYEIQGDWSSDVCSSDLCRQPLRELRRLVGGIRTLGHDRVDDAVAQ